MNRKHTRAVLTTGIAVAALTTSLAAVAPAQAATPAKLSISGDLAIAPGVHLLNIKAEGKRTAEGVTSGTYVATVKNGSAPLPIQLKGPITCLSTSKDTGSLIYPITSTTPDVLPAGLRGQYAVQITVRKGADGMDKVGVMGPMPTSSFHGCKPAATPFGFVGTIALD